MNGIPGGDRRYTLYGQKAAILGNLGQKMTHFPQKSVIRRLGEVLTMIVFVEYKLDSFEKAGFQ